MQDYIKDERIFKSTDFFMLRTPLLSFEKYKDIFVNGLSDEEITQKLIDAVKDKGVREAIAVSSLSLDESIEKLISGKECSKKDQVISSILKYYIRMTSRTTPYGLFSGVTVGKFGDKTEVKLKDKENYIKRARPDMEWLFAIMRKIENDESILYELKVKANELNTINGSRLDLAYVSNYGQTNKDDESDNLTASIRYTDQVKYVMDMAKEPVTLKDILSVIKENNPEVTEEIIKAFLKQLLDNEFLLTEIRPPLINVSPFDYILLKLEKIETAKEIYKQLSEISELIDKYNKLPIGEGLELFNEIISKMKGIQEAKDYLQVDLSIAEEKAILNKDIAREIEEAAKALLRLSSQNPEPYHIKKLKNDFLEKYGYEREISVIELLDEDKGIGAPAGYMMPPSNKAIEGFPQKLDDKKFNQLLTTKIVQALMNKETEVSITEEDIEQVESKKLKEYKLEDLPGSFEFNILISAKSAEEIDKGNYKMFIGPNIGSNTAGKTFGRFADMLSKEADSKLYDIHKQEESLLNEDVIMAEIVCLPQKGRIANVTLSKNYRNSEIVLSTNSSRDKKDTIPVSDLYIGVDKRTSRFYIKSKALNKGIIITTGHMLNPTSGPNIYRFLREISNCNAKSISERIFNNGLDNFPYTPRICYKKTVIKPRTWRVSNEILKLDKDKITKESFYNAITLWKEEWKVDKYVYQQDADNRLLLDLDNKLHLDELYYLLKNHKNSILTLTEVEDGIDNIWVEGSEGKYFSEFVIPILLNRDAIKDEKPFKETEVYKTKSEIELNKNSLPTLDKRRTLFAGDEWLYIKLYGNNSRIDEFIGFNMPEFCNELVNKKYIEKYFFIRYSDPDKHIRLRMKADKETLYSKVMPELNTWFYSLKEEGLLSRVCIDTYFRETERYGGPELIELAEDVFYGDSLLIENIINKRRTGEIEMDLKAIAVASIINIMEEMHIDYETQKNIFIELIDKDRHRGIYQKDRKLYKAIGNSSFDWKSLRETKDGQALYELFKLRKDYLNKYGQKIMEMDEENKLANSRRDILFTLIHMFCNRLFGSNQTEEQIRALVRHTLHDLEYVKKQCQG